jgi:ribosomal protein S18 acetylase RimI-like enzyme
MAAYPEAQSGRLLDLTQVRVPDLEPVLAEEIAVWREQLDWDFSASADLVRRFVDVQALSGFVLLVSDEVAGYVYYVAEDYKGLIGDLYVVQRHRNPENEHRLVRATVETLMRTRRVRRIESQLMLLGAARHQPLPAAKFVSAYERNFMVLDLQRLPGLRPKPLEGVLLDQWTERRQEETAQLIASSYRGHIDSQINDQYRSVAGARRFLFNIVQYPGCGVFHPGASWTAVHKETGRLCGVSLASLVAQDVGHITQICVSPRVQGAGVGYELLRHSLDALADHCVRKVSLTVTAANLEALRLYDRVGFGTVRQFPALVWEGF